MKKRVATMKKRVSKKEFFAAYGLEYVRGKLLAPWGELVNMPLTYGSKTHCYGFSTLAGTIEWNVVFNNEHVSMNGTCVCQCKDCYGCNGRYCMPSVKNANAWRTFAARYFMDWLKRAIIAQVNWGTSGKPLEIVRVHTTGDFFSNDYIQMWKDVKAACPDTDMWTYTKNPSAENAFDNVDGFNIVKSIVPCIGINYGKCDYIIKAYNKLKSDNIPVHVCRCAIDSNQHCNDCRACKTLNYVLFLEHGTTYKPENDSKYNELVAIIDSDENNQYI